MQRILCLIIAVMTLMFSSAAVSYGEIYGVRIHNNWQSFILDRGDQASARITTYSQQDEATLAVDLFANMCSNGYLKIIQTCRDCGQITEPIVLHGESRVDTRAIQTTTYYLTTNNGFLFLNIEPENGYQMLRDIKQGQNIRFKVMLDGKPTYLKFSLLGFTAAYNRARNLCTAASSRENDDARYFNRTPKKTPREPLPDAAYF